MDGPLRVLVDGVPDGDVPITDRAFQYGDGLFETARLIAGHMPLWPLHRRRLLDGAERLGIPLDIRAVERQRETLIAGIDDGVLRITVSRGDGPRGYAAPEPACPRIAGALYPPPPDAHRHQCGVRVRLCKTRLAEQPRLAGIKHLNRLEQVLARSEWRTGEFDEGLMLDTSGRLVEGTFTNLFLLVDGRLCTPPLARCGVAGVMRRYLLAERPSMGGLVPTERDLSLADLERAHECFLCNSVIGVWPVSVVVTDDSVRTMPAVTMGRRIAAEVGRRLGFPASN
jgi:4-amino-4-deoxychorismate lyase